MKKLYLFLIILVSFIITGATYYYKPVETYDMVADFGADPTGVADSATAFNDAMDALKTAPNSKIFIPNGTYSIGSVVTWHSGGILEGESRDGVVIQLRDEPTLSGLYAMFRIESRNVKIKDLTLDGNIENEHPDSTQRTGLYFYTNAAHDCLVENVRVKDWWYRGIVGDYGAHDITVDKCIVENIGMHPILFGSTTTQGYNISILNTKVSRTGSSAMYFDGIKTLKVHGCSTTKETAPAYVYSGTEDGFLIDLRSNNANLEDVDISGNTFNNNLNAGNYMDGVGAGGTSPYVFARVRVHHNDISNVSGSGIDVVTGMTADHNNITDVECAGINIECGWGSNTTDSFIVDSNIIDGVYAISGFGYGICMMGRETEDAKTISNGKIINNIIKDTNSRGMVSAFYFDGTSRTSTGAVTYTNIEISGNQSQTIPTTFTVNDMTEARWRNIKWSNNKWVSSYATTSALNGDVYGYDVLNVTGSTFSWIGSGYPGQRIKAYFTADAGCTVYFAYTDADSDHEYDASDGNLYTLGEGTMTVPAGGVLDFYTDDGITWKCSPTYPQNIVCYVDAGSGIDDESHGLSDSTGAYASIPYALSRIPSNATSATFYLDAEEHVLTSILAVPTQAKNVPITMYGTWPAATVTGKCSGDGVQGANATQGSLTDLAAFTVTAASTVDDTSAKGSDNIYVASTSGFSIGGTIVIGENTGREEVHIIRGISAGDFLILEGKLEYEHLAGDADTVIQGAHAGQFLVFDSSNSPSGLSDDVRVVHWNTAHKLVVVGALDAQPTSSTTYKIYAAPGTVINGGASYYTSFTECQSVSLNRITIKNTYASVAALYLRNVRNMTMTHCNIGGGISTQGHEIVATFDCVLGSNTKSSNVLYTLAATSKLSTARTLFQGGGGVGGITPYGLNINGSSFAFLTNGTIIEGCGQGVVSNLGGSVYFYNSTSYNRIIDNYTYGLYALNGAQIYGTANNVYSGNGTDGDADEQEDGATFGVID